MVCVSPAEIDAISAHLGMSVAGFTTAYLTRCGDDLSIREHPDGRCRFFHDGCRIYPYRPVQCRTWPFWFSNMRSETTWKSVARECSGIGTGLVHDRGTILGLIRQTMPGNR